MASKRKLSQGSHEQSADPFLTHAVREQIVAGLQLPPQQARIVSLILQGSQDKEIAKTTGLSRNTIRTYMRRIFDRLGVNDRVGVVLRAFSLFWPTVKRPGARHSRQSKTHTGTAALLGCTRASGYARTAAIGGG